MSDKIIMLRTVKCHVDGVERIFNERQRYSKYFAGWLPEDSYEAWERKPVVPIPNEIKVVYDG